jgi:hypothetical protein
MRGRLRALWLTTRILSAAMGILAFFACGEKKESPEARKESEEYREAQMLIQSDRPQEALKLIKKYREEALEQGSQTQANQWLDLAISALENIPEDTSILVNLYEMYPSLFIHHEQASLVVAGALISEKKINEYRQLRAEWQERTSRPGAWFVLDADALLTQGKTVDAYVLLNSRSFPGAEDTPRLIRLALINALQNNMSESWRYLTEAEKKDPRNPLIHMFRAQVMEIVNQLSMARVEYIKAVEEAPDNPLMIDQLAEFYRRHKQYALALKTWEKGFSLPNSDILWLQALFWSKTYHPILFDWSSIAVPEGKRKPLIEYLINLPEKQFWDSQKFEKIPDGSFFLSTQQETFWLRLLDMLQKGNEQQALALLEFNPFYSESWAPILETALKEILIYRKKGVFPINIPLPEKLEIPTTFIESSSVPKPPSQLFTQIGEILSQEKSDPAKEQVPADLKALLTSSEAFSATFLAEGWFEAAILLNQLEVIPDNFPDWVAVGFTQALRYNRSDEAALEFANKQKNTPEMAVLIGELMFATNDLDGAMKKIENLIGVDTESGYRATLLMALILIDKGELETARKLLASHPRLANDVLGKETMAQIAVEEGNMKLAKEIYQGIEKESTEAKNFLLNEAITTKHWAKAKELVESLLKDYPDNQQLRADYKKIIDEQKSR